MHRTGADRLSVGDVKAHILWLCGNISVLGGKKWKMRDEESRLRA